MLRGISQKQRTPSKPGKTSLRVRQRESLGAGMREESGSLLCSGGGLEVYMIVALFL